MGDADPHNDVAVSAAIDAAKRAYAPYSRFHVGAYVVLMDGRAMAAANVENASYGLSICAETNAITTLMAQGVSLIRSVTVVGYALDKPDARVLATPCGRCRQVINEFADESTVVRVAYANGEVGLSMRAVDLLPHAFGPQNL